ncbi:hypothetical protein M0804_010029 [Polistes exclamans]|nr:hypothetical protein M0804_010029 [Polistes exclamans]
MIIGYVDMVGGIKMIRINPMENLKNQIMTTNLWVEQETANVIFLVKTRIPSYHRINTTGNSNSTNDDSSSSSSTSCDSCSNSNRRRFKETNFELGFSDESAFLNPSE